MAVKLMRNKSQYEREFTARSKAFNAEFVMELMETCTAPGTERFRAAAEEVSVDADATGQVGRHGMPSASKKLATSCLFDDSAVHPLPHLASSRRALRSSCSSWSCLWQIATCSSR